VTALGDSCRVSATPATTATVWSQKIGQLGTWAGREVQLQVRRHVVLSCVSRSNACRRNGFPVKARIRPVDLQILREWKEEGRVLPANQARRAEANTWRQASGSPAFRFFRRADDIVAAEPLRSSFTKISGNMRFYARVSFNSYVYLVVIIPSLCPQLPAPCSNTPSPTVDADLQLSWREVSLFACPTQSGVVANLCIWNPAS